MLYAARAQLWSSLGGGFRSEAALLLFLLGAPRSPRHSQLRSLSLEAVQESSARDYGDDGRWFPSDEDNYGRDDADVVEAAREVVRGGDLWMTAHPLRHFPPLPSGEGEREALVRLLRATCQSARANVTEPDVARLGQYLSAILHARACTSVQGPGPALPALPLLLPQLTALSIVGADNMVSVDLGCCPNLERLTLRLCGTLERIELGGAGRRLTALEIGGISLESYMFRKLVDGLDLAGCRLQECRLGVLPTDVRHFAVRAEAQKHDLKSSVNAGELFEQNLLASVHPSLARRMYKNSIVYEIYGYEYYGVTDCFLSSSLSTLLAHPALLGELRVLSLHGAWWQVGSRLAIPFDELVRLGRAAPALEALALMQARLPAGLDAGTILSISDEDDDYEPEKFLAPSCLCRGPEGADFDDFLALLESVPGPFTRLTTLVLDGQDVIKTADYTAGLLYHMPALTRFEMAFNDFAKFFAGKDYWPVVERESASIADALRHSGCGGGLLTVFRSHDRILGYVGDDPPLAKRGTS